MEVAEDARRGVDEAHGGGKPDKSQSLKPRGIIRHGDGSCDLESIREEGF